MITSICDMVMELLGVPIASLAAAGRLREFGVGTCIVLLYAALGAGIKYIDKVFDEGGFEKRHALILAPILGLLWAYAMSLHPVSASFLAGTVISVLLAFKIDNSGHLIGAATAAVLGVVLYHLGLIRFDVIVLVVITVAGWLDEIGCDFAKKRTIKNRWLHWFLRCRCLIVIASVMLLIAGHLSGFWFFAILMFGTGYDAMSILTRKPG